MNFIENPFLLIRRKIAGIFIILLSQIVSSCGQSVNKNNNNIIGKYSSKEFNFFEKAYYYVNHIITTSGSSLEINADSTFLYTTCGNIISGRWRIKSDSLVLFIYTNRLRVDSLNSKTFPPDSLKERFKIDKDELKKYFLYPGPHF